MTIDTSYNLKMQQYQQLQKSTQTASTSATSTASTVQEDGTEVEYAAAVTSVKSGDRIEISAEGQKALAQMRAAKPAAESEGEVSDSAQPAPPAGAKPTGAPPAATAPQSTKESDDDESVSSTELYTLSETELQSLLTDGSITRSEYVSELARRGLDNT